MDDFGTKRSFQYKIQFQDGGVDLGTSGTVQFLNFTGAGVTASRVGNTVSVAITGGGGGGSGYSYFPSGWG